MKQWIIKLLSDSKNLPSTRLHLAWGCFFVLLLYIILKEPKADVVWALIVGMSSMSGLSVLEKDKNEKDNGLQDKMQ